MAASSNDAIWAKESERWADGKVPPSARDGVRALVEEAFIAGAKYAAKRCDTVGTLTKDLQERCRQACELLEEASMSADVVTVKPGQIIRVAKEA